MICGADLLEPVTEARRNGRRLQRAHLFGLRVANASRVLAHENTEVGEDVTEQAVRLLHLQGNNGEAELREEVKVRTMHVAWSERPRRRRRLRCTFLTSLRLGQVCTCF